MISRLITIKNERCPKRLHLPKTFQRPIANLYWVIQKSQNSHIELNKQKEYVKQTGQQNSTYF